MELVIASGNLLVGVELERGPEAQHPGLRAINVESILTLKANDSDDEPFCMRN